MSDNETKPAGPHPVIDALECKACGRCIAACPKKVIRFYACPEPNAIEVHIPAKG